jgi:hypothetical protein
MRKPGIEQDSQEWKEKQDTRRKLNVAKKVKNGEEYSRGKTKESERQWRC